MKSAVDPVPGEFLRRSGVNWMMRQQASAKHWIITEQIVADPVSGLTLEFTVTEDGAPSLTLYGDCLVFGNRTIIFENDGQTVHGETAIPTHAPCSESPGSEEEANGERPANSYRSRLGAPR
jgi:hypothetical protein